MMPNQSPEPTPMAASIPPSRLTLLVAWVSLFTPIGALILPLLFLNTFIIYPDYFFGWASLALVFSFIFGVVSLIGHKKHQRRLTIRIAWAGAILSAIFGGFSFIAFIACNAQTSP
jgi:ABC-type sulfate transport system permease subunit